MYACTCVHVQRLHLNRSPHLRAYIFVSPGVAESPEFPLSAIDWKNVAARRPDRVTLYVGKNERSGVVESGELEKNSPSAGRRERCEFGVCAKVARDKGRPFAPRPETPMSHFHAVRTTAAAPGSAQL